MNDHLRPGQQPSRATRSNSRRVALGGMLVGALMVVGALFAIGNDATASPDDGTFEPALAETGDPIAPPAGTAPLTASSNGPAQVVQFDPEVDLDDLDENDLAHVLGKDLAGTSDSPDAAVVEVEKGLLELPTGDDQADANFGSLGGAVIGGNNGDELGAEPLVGNEAPVEHDADLDADQASTDQLGDSAVAAIEADLETLDSELEAGDAPRGFTMAGDAGGLTGGGPAIGIESDNFDKFLKCMEEATGATSVVVGAATDGAAGPQSISDAGPALPADDADLMTKVEACEKLAES